MTTEIAIRPARPDDRAWLLAAIRDLQDYEVALHDSRLPGEAVAESYLSLVEAEAAAKEGAILIADADGGPVGFVAGWVEQDDVLAETADSNRHGYVSDIYVIPGARGRRIAGALLAALERHLSGRGLARLRICALAANASALRAYDAFGFAPYEVVLEKKLRS